MMVQNGNYHLSSQFHQYVLVPNPSQRLNELNERRKKESKMELENSEIEDRSIEYVNKRHLNRDQIGFNMGFNDSVSSDYKERDVPKVVGDSMMLGMKWCQANSRWNPNVFEDVEIYRRICSHVPRRIIHGLFGSIFVVLQTLVFVWQN